jgi:CRP-like cAMP-binding protein
MLLEGSVILQVRARDAVDVEISRLEPGQFFGGFPVLADVPHVDTAETATDVRLLEIDRQAFEYIRIAKPWLGYRLGSAMLRISAQRLSTLFERVRDRL